ncbi:MAG TPA: hypothetical protein PLU64_03840 [Saprospiraceae bacterium]|nr:hypothetical protein [Saprospiraceae bacterium]
MKYLLALLFALFLSGAAFAQIGINATYRSNTAPDWQFVDDISKSETPILKDGYAIGLDYRIPLKGVRIDFLPELNYGHYRTNDFGPGREGKIKNDWISFFLNTNIYFLDLEGDCDCPTFSKSGGLVQKGFFFQISPGLTYLMQHIAIRDEVGIDRWTQGADGTGWSLGAALGLDVGLSDLITLTPIAGFRYYFDTPWRTGRHSFGDWNGYLKNRTSDIRQAYAGLRLGVRFR